jgi:hypothetical protein
MEFQIKEQIKSTNNVETTPTKSNSREKRIFTNGTLSTIAQSSSVTPDNNNNSHLKLVFQSKELKPAQILTPTKLTPIKLLTNNEISSLDISKNVSTTNTPTLTPKQSCVPALNSLINKLNNYQQQHLLNGSTNLIPSSSSSNSSTGSSSTTSSTSSFKLKEQSPAKLQQIHENNNKINTTPQEVNICLILSNFLKAVYKC